jgi:hypothetical protein
LRGIHRAPPGAWAAPLHGANPNTTWRLGLGKGHDWLWQAHRQPHVCLYNNVRYKNIIFSLIIQNVHIKNIIIYVINIINLL